MLEKENGGCKQISQTAEISHGHSGEHKSPILLRQVFFKKVSGDYVFMQFSKPETIQSLFFYIAKWWDLGEFPNGCCFFFYFQRMLVWLAANRVKKERLGLWAMANGYFPHLQSNRFTETPCKACLVLMKLREWKDQKLKVSGTSPLPLPWIQSLEASGKETADEVVKRWAAGDINLLRFAFQQSLRKSFSVCSRCSGRTVVFADLALQYLMWMFGALTDGEPKQ